MIVNWKRLVVTITVALVTCAFGLLIGYTEEEEGFEGWERESVYNSFYDLAQKDKLKGVVVDIKTLIPIPGMAPGVGLIVQS